MLVEEGSDEDGSDEEDDEETPKKVRTLVLFIFSNFILEVCQQYDGK